MSHARSRARERSGFDRFDLAQELHRGLQAAGFDDPRPIQADTIPACLEGRDVMGLAQTGTGKTAAFALPILQALVAAPGPGPRALVLAPTRELAMQIDAEVRALARFTRISSVTIFGGVPARSQIRALQREPEIVVGCPGRVLDLLQQRRLDPSRIETLVLDEADHMFDMGFLPDIRRILAALPDDRQNLLFSATMPGAIRALADRILDEPHVVELAHTAPAERIEHALYPVSPARKKALLDHVLGGDDCRTAIVFTRTKHRARRLARQLDAQGHRAVALQGDMAQSQRDRAMRGFREGRFDVLVATDIAARGIDVAGVDYVINFDPPSTPETYTHRIGRTGRSDRSGKACTFVTPEDAAWVRDTERVLGSRIPQRRVPGFGDERIEARRGVARRAPGGTAARSDARGASATRARPRGANEEEAPRPGKTSAHRRRRHGGTRGRPRRDRESSRVDALRR